MSRMDAHTKAVEAIACDVRQFYERKEKFRISHGSTNSTRHLSSKGGNLVDISGLSHVCQIDSSTQTALVEPNVPMDRLVEETMKHGLVPPVVMEFPGITVGGGYAGTSGESSSFKHGFFDCSINWVEMVLANGDVVTCSEKEKPDLFHGAAGALGTLGVTTLVEIRLMKTKKFVETTYHPVSSVSEATETVQQMTASTEIDYVDGILFSPSQGAVITGRLTDDPKPGIPVRHFSAAGDPWFYLHVQEQVRKRGDDQRIEAIPLAEYFFRYDRGGFWVGMSAFEYFHMPCTRLTRWLLDDFLHTRMMYASLQASKQSDRYVVQDLALPYSTAEQFVEWTDEVFGIWPLWLCPLRETPSPTMHPHLQKREGGGNRSMPMLNIGLWGYGPSTHEEFVEVNRRLERKVQELGGMKWLYAHTYYTEEEFWEIYDKDWYDSLREKYGATSLPTVYEKVRRVMASGDKEPGTTSSPAKRSWYDTWPIGGIYGLRKAIESGSYVQAKSSSWKSRVKLDHISKDP